VMKNKEYLASARTDEGEVNSWGCQAKKDSSTGETRGGVRGVLKKRLRLELGTEFKSG